MSKTNRAAYQPAMQARAFEVKSAPYPTPTANSIVIKNHALAINPADWLIQEKGDMMYRWLKYPFVLGMDCAGEVVEVGEGVTRFRVGDRVLGFPRGADEKVNNSAEGGFQEYTLLQADLTSQIPAIISYEQASVIPLGAGTAAAGLFQKDQLGLHLPVMDPKPTGKTLIIWGGSTSVGSNAIQLAVSAGYEVFTTASPKNFEYVKKLGASQVFDYRSKTVNQDMIKALKGKTIAGALSIGSGAAEACMTILSKTNGGKFIAMATYPMLQPEPTSLVTLRTAYHFVSWIISFKIKGMFKGIKSNFIFGSTIAFNEIGAALYRDFLPEALEKGKFVPAPEVQVVGQGLESIQGALAQQKQGVSAKKLVVTL